MVDIVCVRGRYFRASDTWEIAHYQDEQERVQKKTFTNWMNTYLKQKNMKVENLFEDIKDGVHLLSLLEVLSGERLPMERGRLKRVHHVSNLSTALKFLETKKIKLVNINVSDIADGKPSIVLGLIWTIILYFQIEDTFAQAGVGEDGEPRPLSALEKFRKNAKKALLAWTGNAITKRYGIEITNFGKSWRDGLAFNAIIHTIRPDLVDFEQVRQQNARVNLEQAFSTAENSLGIPRLLDPEDVDVEKPDEKSIMTYVAQFLKAYPEAGEDPSLAKRKKNPAEQELADYTDLITWLNTEADEVLQIVDQPVTDRQQEYMDYLAFKTEVDRREKTFKKLEEKAKTKSLQRLTPEQWKELDTKWNQVYRQTRMWLWKLDASLPGETRKIWGLAQPGGGNNGVCT
ncbi:spectrin beta chain, erythrocytic-like isoform X2 [Pecten maximus]|uniref:spectrin beta chain, erythrocytic-like isoform X2 n=1 Tax=Pecten maximus TaxID=6579 RepID=UPI001457F071|nr:spectrin beta chain, erythrocytic-like isoform X2 [Pecten maximus]